MKSTGLQVTLKQTDPIPLNVEFTCEPGEVLALVGPSGSGKTTVLRCIAGLYKPASGSVNVGEQQWLDSDQSIDLSTQKRRVGLVFQNFALFPHLSVFENIEIALNHLSTDQRRLKSLEYLDTVGLSGLGDRYPDALSGGQQQRVALARALARNPSVLLLDEPFSAVDQVTRRKLRVEMAAITKQLNIPIILVTHDLDEACTLANRMCVLRAGTSLQIGTPDEVMRKPSTAEVARVIDVRNLFTATVIEIDKSNDITLLQWESYQLKANYDPRFAVGDKLKWCIQPADLLLHQRVRPSNGERENPIQGYLESSITIAGISSFTVRLAESDTLIYLDLPPHVVRRNKLKIEDCVGISVLKNMLHLMPA